MTGAIHVQGTKNSTHPLGNFGYNLERMSNYSQGTRPVGRVLWEELLEEVILHITHLCSLLHYALKEKCMCLQDE